MNNCKTCKHAEFQRTVTGRIKRNEPGRCTYPFVAPPMPDCMLATYRKVPIWPHRGENCPTWASL